MATFHGNDGEVHIGANTVLEVVSFDWTNSCDWAEDHSAGATKKSRKPGKLDGQGTITCRNDPGDATGQQLLKAGETVTVILYPGGTTSGCDKLEGSIDVVSVGISMNQDDINERSIAATGYLDESVVTP